MLIRRQPSASEVSKFPLVFRAAADFKYIKVKRLLIIQLVYSAVYVPSTL